MYPKCNDKSESAQVSEEQADIEAMMVLWATFFDRNRANPGQIE